MGEGTHACARLSHIAHGHGSFEGRSSRRYDVMARRLIRGVYRRIAEDIALVAPAGGAVLDVGTGPGVLVTEIARARTDLRVTGIDPSAGMVAAAERNVRDFAGRASVRSGDVAELPFLDDAFDIVVTSFSLHHWDDVEAAVPEISRVLRPGGHFYVYDFQRAPFDTLDRLARNDGHLQPAGHMTIRLGRLHLRHCVRHVLSA